MTTATLRVVIVTFNNAGFIDRCLRAVIASRWDGQREIVVVDNASRDSTADLVARDFPEIRLIRTTANLGFAGGNNLALKDLTGIDYVALVNSDAFVADDWLLPLRAALEGDGGLGATCPKILYASQFCEVAIKSSVFVPGGADQRVLGRRVVDVRTDGNDVFGRCVFVDGGWSWPEEHARWTTGAARLWVPVDDNSRYVTVAFDRGGELRTPVGERFDVVNNAGVELLPSLEAKDRGLREIDEGQYDSEAEVWGWCGGAVLLRAEYLRTVGLFDDRFFLYYEDTELAWRGRREGWRYRYVPGSVVRHIHGGSMGEYSDFFYHLNQRNRLVMVTRHAGLRGAARAWWRYARDVGSHARGEILRPLLHGRRPSSNYTRRSLRAAAAAVRMLLAGRSRLPLVEGDALPR